VSLRPFTVRLDRPPVSVRVGRGTVWVAVIAVAATIALLAIGAGSGSYPLSPAAVVDALLGRGDADASLVVWTLRVPRLLVAVLAGAALGISGAIFQSVARNPLVSPDVIGINGGAALAAVGVIVLGATRELVAPAALAGAFLAALVVYLSANRGGLDRTRLVLIGIGVAAFTQAGVSFLFTRSESMDLMAAQSWLVGSLHDARWPQVQQLALTLVLLVPVALAGARTLVTMELGDDAAAGLGVATERSRRVALLIAVALAAIAVSVTGPIAFVAFIAPHLARRLTRAAGGGLLPVSAAVGALVLVAADLVARRVADPTELPVGIVTILLGAPLFLWLLVRPGRPGARDGA
jgi:iron complex transport system permease protein